MDDEDYYENFPYWVLKVLPVLTGHLSLKDFESWLYLPQSEDYFPNDVYIELISIDYNCRVSNFIDCIQVIISFKNREKLNSIVSFVCKPKYINLPDWDDFILLPVPQTLLEFIWDRIRELLDKVYLSEKSEKYEEFRLYNKLLSQYLEKVILLLRDNEKYTELEIRRELNTIFRSEKINLLKEVK